MSTTTTPRDDQTNPTPPDLQSSSVLGWVALACSVGWVAGFGSLAGVVLGTWSIVRARRRGLRTPVPAVVAIVIGAVALVLSIVSVWLVIGGESMSGVTTGSTSLG
ncbi:hypothetical protein QE364_003584 [Nocardioides zeae]|uniref:Uncharacterized protein n=1 Tax=Nocardioides zeae TaxID=1457234 RepID=A0ACC6IMI0_9ACTN|nr:DUF4190 domain-containing protein [Nocardioides zeae]MDR6173858.1 hypothetical protein [Nocardioides zeae]MDR6211853.1 hypothetical protein [Nocardioides zeae]